MTNVLISYSREDRDVASQIARLLETEKFSTWWDFKISGGANFRDAINEEISKADKVIVIWSENSVKSEFVIDEAARAKAAGKLIPISIDGSLPPLGFGGIHTIQMADWSRLPPELLGALTGVATLASPDLAASIRAPIRGAALAAVSSADQTGFLAAAERDVAGYLRWFFAAMTNPTVLVARTAEAQALSRHIPYVVRIVLVSVAIGASLGVLIPARAPLINRIEVFIGVSLLWMFLSLLVHGVCRALGGRASADTTLLLMMQSLAFAYVASNFLTVLYFYGLKFYAADLYPPTPLVSGFVLLGLQFVILLFLVPATVSNAHGFTGVRWLFVALSAALFTLVIGLPVAIAGGC